MSTNKSGCIPVIIFASITLIIGLICNHVAEESKKMDSFSNFFIGVIIVGLIFLCYYFASNKKKS